jgi:hypothetical protein
VSLKAGKVNLLNVLGLRRVQFPAYHFHFTTLERYRIADVKQLSDWITLNLNGRFYIGQGLILSNNQFIYVTKLGFEKEKELSYFKLACPNIL